MSLVCATHGEWHVCKSLVSKTQVEQFPGQSSKGLEKPKGPPLVSPIDSQHLVFSTCHFVRVRMQERTIMPPLHATHGECHVYKCTTITLHTRLVKPKLPTC